MYNGNPNRFKVGKFDLEEIRYKRKPCTYLTLLEVYDPDKETQRCMISGNDRKVFDIPTEKIIHLTNMEALRKEQRKNVQSKRR